LRQKGVRKVRSSSAETRLYLDCWQASEDLEPNNCSLTIEWMTTEQAAEYLGLSVGSLRNMTSNGHVTYYKLQNRNRYRITRPANASS
jgi:excisionase family DNA binding protein